MGFKPRYKGKNLGEFGDIYYRFSDYKRSKRLFVRCRDGSIMPWARIFYEHKALNGAELSYEIQVHHIDGNVDNDAFENLGATHRSDHQSIHRETTRGLGNRKRSANTLWMKKSRLF